MNYFFILVLSGELSLVYYFKRNIMTFSLMSLLLNDLCSQTKWQTHLEHVTIFFCLKHINVYLTNMLLRHQNINIKQHKADT